MTIKLNSTDTLTFTPQEDGNIVLRSDTHYKTEWGDEEDKIESIYVLIPKNKIEQLVKAINQKP